MHLSLRNLNVALISIYIIFTYLLPSLFVNKIIFAVLIFTTLLIFVDYAKKYNVFINPFVIQLIYVYGYIISLFADCNAEFSTQFLLAPLSLFLIYLVQYYEIDLSLIIRRVGLILSLVVIGVYTIYLINDQLYSVIEIYLRLYSGGAAGASERDFLSTGDGGNSVLLFALPGSYHLFLPLLLYFQKYLNSHNINSFMCFVVVLFAVVLAGARGQWIISLLFLYIIYFFSASNKNRICSVFVILLAASFLFYYLYEYTLFFSTNEASNSTKIDKVVSFVKSLDWIQLITGNGLAAYYYVEGFGKSVFHTELSLLDQVRYVGLLQTMVYIFALICPIWLRPQLGIRLKVLPLIICLGFLIYSFTNPVLVNSLGHIVILWYWSQQFVGNENKCLSGHV